LRHGT